MIEFGWPWFFYLLPLPLLAWLLPRANRQEAALKTPSFNTLKSLGAELEQRSSRYLWRGLVVLLWLAIIIAGSQPKWIGEPITLPSSGRDLLLAVDIVWIHGHRRHEAQWPNGHPTRRGQSRRWRICLNADEYSALIPLLQRQVLCVDTTASTLST